MTKCSLFCGVRADLPAPGFKTKSRGRIRYRPLPFGMRLTSWIIISIQLLIPCQSRLLAVTPPAPEPAPATAHNQNLETEKRMAPSRTPSQVKPPSLIPNFSENPSDVELFNAHVFGLPLVLVGGQTSSDENKALARTIVGFVRRTNYENVETLTTFLDQHPNSPWRASLLFNLGKIYRSNGYISHALACWESVWELVKAQNSDSANTVANATLGELAELYGRLGRADAVEKILSEADARSVSGQAAAKLYAVRQGLWIMRNHPEKGFMCGPFALPSVLTAMGEKEVFPSVLENACSTTNGTSLAQLKRWADQMNMHMQMAKREIGAEIPLPAVVNWKAGHFAALIKKEGGRYLMKDPIFEQEIWMSKAALDSECSGYFLVPNDELPAGWRPVSFAEAENVWGKGPAFTAPLFNQGPMTPHTCPIDQGPNASVGTGSDGGDPDDWATDEGMASYRINALLASLEVSDTPLAYTPPRGAGVHFSISYDQFEINLLSGISNVANLLARILITIICPT